MRLALTIALVIATAGSAHAAPRCTTLASCKTACTGGDGRSCRDLGKLLLRATPVDLVAAAAAYSAGCDHGDAVSCAALALQVQDGRGVAWDQARAAKLYQRACEGGAGVGCFNVGIMYNEGNGLPHDRDKAKAMMTRALALYGPQCEADVTWCVNIGYLYEGDVLGTPDLAAAAAVYRKACDRNDPDACASLASFQLDGRGVTKDVKAGTALLEKTCAANGALACSMLGDSLITSDPKLTPPRAVTLTERGCELGNPQACSKFGAMVDLGIGGTKDRAKSAAAHERACALGDHLGCISEASVLAATDPRAASGFLLRGCRIGDPESCHIYVKMMLLDKVVPVDRAGLHDAATQLCSHGDKGACDALTQLAKPAP